MTEKLLTFQKVLVAAGSFFQPFFGDGRRDQFLLQLQYEEVYLIQILRQVYDFLLKLTRFGDVSSQQDVVFPGQSGHFPTQVFLMATELGYLFTRLPAKFFKHL